MLAAALSNTQHAKDNCTYNLHLLVCQLLVQVLNRGTTYELFELWVERLIGLFKQRVKYRTRSNPEKTMMIDEMIRRALKRWRLQFASLLTWQEYSGQHKQQRNIDGWCASASGELLGAGQPAASGMWTAELQSAAKNAVECNIEDEGLKQLWLDNWDRVVVEVYKEAILPGGFYATSTAFSRSRTRDGSFVAIPYATPNNDEVKPWVGRVNRYLQLQLPADVELPSPSDGFLLMAVCDLLPYLQPYEDYDICGLDSIILYRRDRGTRQQTYAYLDYPVLLSNIYGPLFRQEFQGEDEHVWWAFVPLRFRTGGRRR